MMATDRGFVMCASLCERLIWEDCKSFPDGERRFWSRSSKTSPLRTYNRSKGRRNRNLRQYLKIHQNIRDYNRRGPISRGPIIRAPTMYKDSISHSRSRVLFMWLLFSKSWDEKDDRMLSVSFRGVVLPLVTSTLTRILL